MLWKAAAAVSQSSRQPSSWAGTMRTYGTSASVANTSAAGTIFVQNPGTNGTLDD